MDAGDLIQDRYRLMERLGRGGMGQVWQAQDLRLERTVAVKLMTPGLAEEAEFLVRFLREAQSVARINHPNVVNILDFGEIDGSPFLVMEYVPGQSLADTSGEPMDQDHAREVIAQAAAGAGAAHAVGIIHRDIKPGNILVTEDGRTKLVDFGIASATGAERLTVTGTTIGSPHYISPEQASGQRATPASDVYSFGVVLYEIVTATKPFEGDNVAAIAAAQVEEAPEPPSTHLPGLDSGLEAVIMRCLLKDPDARYSDGNALAEALRQNAPARTAVMAVPAVAVAGDTAVLSAADFADDSEPEPPRDSLGKAILVGLGIGLVILAIFIGVLLLVRDRGGEGENRSGRNGGGGGGPAPQTSAEDIAPDTDVGEGGAPAPDIDNPGDEAEPPPGEGKEDDTEQGPGQGGDEGNEGPGGGEEDPSDEEDTGTEEDPGEGDPSP